MTTETKDATLWICESCGFIYDPAIGDPDGGIPPGTAFEDIPKDWFCPVCGARTSDFRPLEQQLWELTERVSDRLKAKALAGSTVTLKLKTADFKLRTRARALGSPTQLAALIFAAGRDLLKNEVGATRFRLIGIGVSNLEDAVGDELADLLDRRTAQAEHAVDRLRSKFGRDAVVKGLAIEDE